MHNKKHKIPFLLKLKRLKNSDTGDYFNNLFSYLKSAKKFRGKPRKILLIRNDRIGDAVVTLPVIRDIKLNNPGIIIEVLASDSNKFVFDDFAFADDVIVFDRLPQNSNSYSKFPVIGSAVEFFVYFLFPFLFSSSGRNEIKRLRNRNYDAVVDLVGLKRNILLGKIISRYVAGPKKFGAHFLYDYYISSNWVSPRDNDFMTVKIEKLFAGAFGFDFEKRNRELPFTRVNRQKVNIKNDYEIIIHIGTSDLRKLPFHKEEKFIELLNSHKILVIDSSETKRFLKLKEHFAGNGRISFKTFNSLKDIAVVCNDARLLVCYDGGQAHYLSQYIRTLVIFGPGSVALWKPFEFSEYSLLKEFPSGVRAEVSNGKNRHIVLYYPVWCRPCFDVGCRKKPCTQNIEPEQIADLVDNYCMKNDK